MRGRGLACLNLQLNLNFGLNEERSEQKKNKKQVHLPPGRIVIVVGREHLRAHDMAVVTNTAHGFLAPTKSMMKNAAVPIQSGQAIVRPCA